MSPWWRSLRGGFRFEPWGHYRYRLAKMTGRTLDRWCYRQARRKLMRHPLIQKGLTGFITMGEVRNLFLGFLQSHGTFAVCQLCAQEDRHCCHGCVFWAPTGCSKRNTGCLGFSCYKLGDHLGRRGRAQFRLLVHAFGHLDGMRAYRWYPDFVQVQIRPEKDKLWAVVVEEQKDQFESAYAVAKELKGSQPSPTRLLPPL